MTLVYKSTDVRIHLRPKELRVDSNRIVLVPYSVRSPEIPVKAWETILRLNDAIIKRVAFDTEHRGAALQSPNETLRRGKGVCMDYAALFEAGARQQNIDVKSLVSSSMNHAWNAVKIGAWWWLVDVTWNTGGFLGSGEVLPKSVRFDPDYRRKFLLTTPEIEHSQRDAGLISHTHDAPDIREIDYRATLKASRLIRKIDALLASRDKNAEIQVEKLYREYKLLESRYPLDTKLHIVSVPFR